MPEMPKIPGAFPLTHLWFLYQLLLIYVAVLAIRAHRRAPRSRAEAARPRRHASVAASIRTSMRPVRARPAAGGRADGAAVLVLLAGHPDARPVADPAAPRLGRVRHGVRVRLAGASLARTRWPPSTQRWFAHLVLARASPPAGCCTRCTRSRWRSPGSTKTLFALALRRGGLGLGVRPHRRRAALPVQLQRHAPLHRRRFVLDLPRAPAGGRGVPGVGRPLAAALEREVSVHPGRELRGAVPELPLPRAADVHRPAAERPQVSLAASPSAPHASSPGSPAPLPAGTGDGVRSRSCAASPSASAP